jgi:hypothetical protein
MREEWKDIKGYEGLYQVSNYGRIRSLDRYIIYKNGKVIFKRGQFKRIRKDSRDLYMLVDLSKDDSRETKLVHRLVADAFIRNQNNLPQVNHKDENKKNNNADNLEWCNQKYNTNYGTCIARIVKNNKDNYERLSKNVVCLNDMKVFKSTIEAGNYYNVDCSNVSRVCNGLRKHSKGYIFAYVS